MSFAAAVTGLGCICAAGENLPRVMAALYAGERRCAPPRDFTAELDTVYPVFNCGLNENYELFNSPTAIRHPQSVTRTSALALAAAREACAQAGLDGEQLATLRVGVCLGTTVGCTLNDEVFYRNFKQGAGPAIAPIQRYLANNPALFLKQALGLRGPAATVANACSSGTDAIGQARAWLRAGLCDVVLAGGADELSRIPYLGFVHLLIASPEPCRPFDRARRGLNLGEGAGVLVLETAESAARRGACVLAEVAGYGCANDAWHPTAPHPEGKGLRRAIDSALRDAGIEPGAIGFINAHGTSTPDNDKIEGRVLGALFPAGTPVVSTKAYTGHTLGAAGGIEAVLTVQALLDQRLPATAGFAESDPDCAITPTARNTEIEATAALSDSLAFGGNNAVLVFRKDKGQRTKDEQDPKDIGKSSVSVRDAASTMAILGIGTVSALGCGVASLAEALRRNAQPAIQTHAIQTARGLVNVPVFTATPEGLDRFMPKRSLRRLDKFVRLALLASFLAVEDSGLELPDRARVGVVFGTGYGPLGTTFEFQDTIINDGDKCASPTAFAGSVHNAPASQTAIALGLEGPCQTLTTFGHTAEGVLQTAEAWLREGLADLVLAGLGDEFHPVGAYAATHMDFEQCSWRPGEMFSAFLLGRPGEREEKYGNIAAIHALDGADAGHAAADIIARHDAVILSASSRRAGRLDADLLPSDRTAVDYSSFYGCSPTALGMDLAAAALALQDGAPPLSASAALACAECHEDGSRTIVSLIKDGAQ